MPNRVLDIIKHADEFASRAYLKHMPEKNALLGFYFHGVYRDHREMNSGVIDPREGTNIQCFRPFVEYYLEHGYTFVSADDILLGLNPHKRYVSITFDDGYANNQLVLPLLHEYKIPVTFFISTGYVERNQSYWWDVLYRERAKRGVAAETIRREGYSLKYKKQADIDAFLRDSFGQDASRPVGDLDRPFTPSELKEFSRDPYVCLGNHTRDHAILTNYSEEEIESQISHAQEFLGDILARRPTAIAYPNGRYSPEVVRIARQAGLRLGFTVVQQKNFFPADSSERAMCLARFHLSQKRDVVRQSELFRSDLLLYPRIRNLFKGADD